MQLRTIALVFSIVGLFYSGFVSALGLGEITLKSQFNQPLNAEVRLLKVRDLSKEEIFATLASREDFKRAGVDRLFLLSGLKFEVVLDNPVKPFIRVTSNKPILEPYLNFLVEVQWPSGRLLREYTLLLDLPVFNDSGSNAPVTVPGRSVVASPVPAAPRPQVSEPRPQIVPPRPKSSSRSTSVVRQAASGPDSYKVKSGDTLWEIAASTLADSPASINQRMIAIQQANPSAFADGNINRLRNGRVLRIPSVQEVTDISNQQALSAVREQNKTWSSEAKSTQKAVLTSAAPSTRAAISSGQPEGRLTLGSASSGQSSKGSGASGAGESLQNELANANDELARATRQNDELKSRITELEAQIETMENLVSVTNDQLKALQVAAEKTDDVPVGEPVAIEADATVASIDPATTDSVTEDSTTGSASDAIAEQVVAEVVEPDTVAQEQVAAVAEPSPFSTPEPVTANVPAPTKPSLLEAVISFLTENMLIIGGGVLAFLALLLVLLKLRNKTEEDEVEEFSLDDEGDDLFALDDEAADILAESEDNIEEDDDLSVDDLSIDDDLTDSVQAQTEDVVAEADIYISLGQEDKAVELLQKEIQENPENADARLGLLKIYAKSQDSVGFDEQYAQLLPLGNVYANDQAMALRKEIDNAEPFDTDKYSLDNEELDTSSDLDFLKEAEESDLDLDIDLDMSGESKDDDDAIAESDSDLSLDDISLDLGDLGDETLDLDQGSPSSDTDFSLDLDELDDSESQLEDALTASTEVDIAEDLGDIGDLEDIEFSLDLDEESPAEDLPANLDKEVGDSPVEGLDEELEDIEFDLDLDMDDELSESVDDLEDALPLDNEELVISTAEDLDDISVDDGLENDFSVELDGDLNDVELDDEAPNESLAVADEDIELSIDEEDIDFSIDEDIELSVDEGTELAVDEDTELSIDEDAELSIDEDVELSIDEDAELSIDEDTELSIDEDTELSIDEDVELAVDEDTELAIDEDTELSIDEDVELAVDEDAELSIDEDAEPAVDEDTDDDSLDLDSPPPADIDMASLDQEIDAMTADMNELSTSTADEASVNNASEGDEAVSIAEAEVDEGVSSSAKDLEELEATDTLDLDSEIEQAAELSVSSDLEVNDASEDSAISEDDELDFFEESDEVSTKLDLAKAYMDMGDREGAEDILDEVMEEGSEQQKSDAKALMDQL